MLILVLLILGGVLALLAGLGVGAHPRLHLGWLAVACGFLVLILPRL